MSLWRDPDDVSHCRILFPDKTEWRLISATSADEDAVLWLTSYSSRHAYETKKKDKWFDLIRYTCSELVDLELNVHLARPVQRTYTTLSEYYAENKVKINNITQTRLKIVIIKD